MSVTTDMGSVPLELRLWRCCERMSVTMDTGSVPSEIKVVKVL